MIEYKYHRQRGRNATDALRLARDDISAGTKRYLSGSGWNPKFSAFGESHMRWIENPAACGLRFVGYADDLTPLLDHNGWYLDYEGNETARGIVYQLPARRGRPIFVCGYADPYNRRKGREYTNPAALSFDVIYGESGYFSTSPIDNPDAADAGRFADRITEIMAEAERDYQEVYRARHDFEDCADEIKTTRRNALDLIADIKKLCPDLVEYSAASAALRSRLESMLESIRELRNQRETLVCDYGSRDGWNDY